MFKKLFDFKGGPKLVLGRIILLAGLVIAIVIFAFGMREIFNIPHMKEVLDAPRPIMGDVLGYLAQKYLVWVGAVLVVSIGGFLVLRFLDNKEKAAA